MSATERIREPISSPPEASYWRERVERGWRPVAVEWDRPAETADGTVEIPRERREVPFGLRVADDCQHLETDEDETRTLASMLELLVDDELTLGEVAAELNRRGLTRRDGGTWTQRDVFELLPRVVEASPPLLAGTDLEALGPRRRAG